MKTASPSPSPNGSNGGRDSSGRFGAGNGGGPGNPYSRQTAELRAAMFRAITAQDIQTIIAKLVAMAKEGNLAAAKEVLGRTVGSPVEAELQARLDELEDQLKNEPRRGHYSSTAYQN